MKIGKHKKKQKRGNSKNGSLQKLTMPKRMRKLAKNLEDKYYEEEKKTEEEYWEKRRLAEKARTEGDYDILREDEIVQSHLKYFEEMELLIKQTELNGNGSWVVVESSNGRPFRKTSCNRPSQKTIYSRPFKKANYRYNVKLPLTLNFLERNEGKKMQVWVEEGVNLKKFLNAARPKKQRRSKSKKHKRKMRKNAWIRSFCKRVFSDE